MSNTQLKFAVHLRNGVRMPCRLVNQVAADLNQLLFTEDGVDAYRRIISGHMDFKGHASMGNMVNLKWIGADGKLLPDVASVVHATAVINYIFRTISVVNPILPESLYYDPLEDYSPS